jgi:prepilin peptidase CpaA
MGWESLAPGAALQPPLTLVPPFLLTLWMAWKDAKTHRIPNYLVLTGLLTGLGYQLWAHGWNGLLDGLLGIGLGFMLLIFFYLKGGFGAGDVKALAAVGAWLGPWQTLYLFIYMAIAGIFVVLFFWCRRGLIMAKVPRLWGALLNLILLRPHLPEPRTAGAAAAASPQEGIPYAISLALGMAILWGHSLANSSSDLASFLGQR